MWRIRVKELFLLIFAIILCIYPLYTSAQGVIFSYTEKNENGRPLRVFAAKKFDDGTVVARIIRDDAISPSCYYDTFSLRIIHPNGTVDERDIGLTDLGTQQFNYCKPEGEIDYHLIKKDQILVTYFLPTDDGITFEQWGVVYDFNGKELNRKSLGKTIGPISRITLNSNKDNGFLMLTSMKDTDGTNYTTWVQYKIDKDGAFTELTGGDFNFDFFSSLTATVISTVGEGYAVLYANMKNNYLPTNPLLSQGILYALTIGYNQTTVSPLLLYQTPLPDLNFRALYCDISYSGVGQVCTLTISQADATGQPTRNFYIKVNFLSSGSVTSSKVITRAIPNDVPSILWRVDVLPFGGFMFSNTIEGAQSSITGYLFGEEDTTSTSWGLPIPEPINPDGISLILPNNTLLVFQKEAPNSWQIEAVELSRFDDKVDNGYSNINVLSTVPGIGGLINDNDTTNILIDFYNPVELSDGNLLIYQEGDNNERSLRQMIPGTKCQLVNEEKTVNVSVLISTFSIPNGYYFIMMESNFVKDKAYKEPLLGIREEVWWFNTEDVKTTSTPSKSGLFRLTTEGTQYYDSLDRGGRRDFFKFLKDQLALAVPVDPSRLFPIEKVQVDRTVNDKQYLLSISIKESKAEDAISVATIIDYINTMVENQDQTQIGKGNVTKYLDQTYGFDRILNIWEKYQTILIVLFFIIIFLFGSFLSAEFKIRGETSDTKKNIRNIAILQLGLVIFDLAMDILFVSNSSKDFQELYIPSVVFVTVPIAINTILAFYIITQENSSNQKFYQWFIKNGKVASVFTVLAGADIEALNILHSNLVGLELFGAPFSPKAKNIITKGGYANIFTEDIPQVIIQIVYYNKAVSYGLIPLLTFISSVLTLAINLASILYENIVKKRNNNDNTDDVRNSDNTNSEQLQEDK